MAKSKPGKPIPRARRTVSVAAKAVVSSIPATIALVLAVVVPASAQQPSTSPPAPPPQAAPPPNPGVAQQGAPSGTAQTGQLPSQLIASPWTKYCTKGLVGKSSEISTKGVCFTAADGHLETGQKIVNALLIEPDEGDAKLFRVTVPLGVGLIPGVRIVFDGKEAMTAPFVVCLAKSGCMADFKADADLIAKLKNGQSLSIQTFDKGHPIGFTFSLGGFAAAYDGPPSDPLGANEEQERQPSGSPPSTEPPHSSPVGK